MRRGSTYTFHAPLSRAACEALGRATAARLGRRFGRDLALTVADLGWSLRLPEGAALERRGGRAAPARPRGSPTTCSTGSTAANSPRGGSGTSPRRR